LSASAFRIGIPHLKNGSSISGLASLPDLFKVHAF
uniref:Sulfonamide-resistant dihydropteroate synthase Sul1 n=1 Tax=Brugia timori TaxID=42155 RepID=A0A0R3Q8J5_9BILA